VDDTRDRRIVHVALTDRGQRLVDRVFTALMEHGRALLATLAREDRTTLTAILRRWLVTFEGANSAEPS
jgi:DNA-binding MarR family transcriptional regulator